MEEMITEELDGYRNLRDWRDRYTPETMLVDGEGDQGRNTIYWEMMEQNLLDAIQPDMLHLGFWPFHRLALDIIEAGYDTKIAPHNFNAARIGLSGVVQFGAVTDRFTVAEDSTLDFDIYDASAYEFENGRIKVPTQPGLAITVNQDLYAKRHSNQELVVT